MSRLLEDASALAGKEFKMGNFADIIEAIHVIQESMGITGTTAQEASETINGSIASWKSALDNLLTGIGRNENIDQLVDNLVDSTEDVIANLIPAIRRASEGFMQVIRVAVVRIGPQVMDAFRDIWNNKLPGILTSAANGIIGLINDIFGTNIPTIGTIELPKWEDLSAIVSSWWNGIKENIRTIATWTVGIFTEPSATASAMQSTFGRWWQMTARPQILSISTWALNLFGLPDADENTITAHVEAWWSGVVGWVQNACVWTLQMFGFAPDAATNAVDKISGWFGGVVDLLGDTLTLIFDWASGVDASTLRDKVESIYEDAKTLIGDALEFTWSLVPGPIQEKLQPLVDGLSEWWTNNEQTITDLLGGINDLYNFLIGTAAGMFSDALSDEELWAAVGSFLSSFIDAAKSIAEALAPVADATFGAILDAIKYALIGIEPAVNGIADVIGYISTTLSWIAEHLGFGGSEPLSAEQELRLRYAQNPSEVIAEIEGMSQLEKGFAYKTLGIERLSQDEIDRMRTGGPAVVAVDWASVLSDSEKKTYEDLGLEVGGNEGGPVVISTDWSSILTEEQKKRYEELGLSFGGGGGKPGTEDVVTELETVKTEIQGLRNDLMAAVQSLMNRPISIDGQIITNIIGQGIMRKARTTFG